MSFAVAAQLSAWVVIVLLALAMAGLYARVRELEPGSITFADQLVGSYAPAMSDGRALTDTLVLFLSDRCGVCRELLTEAAAMRREGELPGSKAISVFSTPGVPAWALEDGIEAYADAVFADRFHITAMPTVVYIDGDGRTRYLAAISSPERFRAETAAHKSQS